MAVACRSGHGSESKRQRERRAAHRRVLTHTCDRRSIGCDEIAELFKAIDFPGGMEHFGVRALTTIHLDGLHRPPPSTQLGEVAFEPEVTLLAYAAWRRRDELVLRLLRGGANPTVRYGSDNGMLTKSALLDLFELMRSLKPPVAVYLVEQIVRLRAVARSAAMRTGKPLQACIECGSSQAPIICEPCGHVCCEACIWKRLCKPTAERGELRCPHCSSVAPALEQPCTGSSCTARGPSPINWNCLSCCHGNAAWRKHCKNCGCHPALELQTECAANFNSDGSFPADLREPTGPSTDVSLAADATVAGQDEEIVEVIVEKKRNIGRKLCFLIGHQVGSENQSPRQIVLDHSVMDLQCPEVQLIKEFSIGERVRAIGRSVSRVDGLGYEILATECVLLRPIAMMQEEDARTEQVTNKEPQKRRAKIRAMPAADAAVQAITGLSHEQRLAELADAAHAGDVIRISALASAGVDLSLQLNEYGHAAIFVAAFYGHCAALQKLVDLRAQVDCCAYGGATPAIAAAANGHFDCVRILDKNGADLSAVGSQGNSATHYVTNAESPIEVSTHGSLPVPQFRQLIEPTLDHPGAGSFYIDKGFSEVFLSDLEKLQARLPVAASQRATQGQNDRFYYCDAEGWISAAIRHAVQACGAEAPCRGMALPYMRFLRYNEAGGGLPPHTDLSRTDHLGRTSRHTFILYITTCAIGGETVLLEDLNQPTALASVQPHRGRLLIFPHMCPHMAKEVVAEGLPKLLLRGEIL